MAIKRVTREDLKNLKRKRKKRIYAMSMLFVICLLLLAGAVFFLVYKIKRGRGYTDAFHAVMPTEGVTADLGVAVDTLPSAIDYSFIEDRKNEDELLEGVEFTVPDTSLATVEEIEGDNWYDENVYQRVSGEPIKLSYFNHTVFIGDSRTEGLLLYAGLPNLNGFCYKGLSVDKLASDKSIVIPGMDGKYSCYEAIEMFDYDNYYCMFGVNELGWVHVETFIRDFNELLDHIREVNPDAMIYVESILPVTEKLSTDNDIYKQERIDEFNEQLLEMCKERGDVIYLDIAAAVTDETGYLPEEATTDGIHCNSNYCKRVIEYIRCNVYEKK